MNQGQIAGVFTTVAIGVDDARQQCCLQGKHGLLDHLKDDGDEPASAVMPEDKAEHNGTSVAETEYSTGADHMRRQLDCLSQG